MDQESEAALSTLTSPFFSHPTQGTEDTALRCRFRVDSTGAFSMGVEEPGRAAAVEITKSSAPSPVKLTARVTCVTCESFVAVGEDMEIPNTQALFMSLGVVVVSVSRSTDSDALAQDKE